MFDKFPRRGSCPAARFSAAGLAGFVVASVLLAAAPLRTASYTWAVASGDWSVASNWTGSLPTSGDTAYVVNGGTVNVTRLRATCGALSLGGSAGSGTLQMTGGSLSAASYEYVGDSGTGSLRSQAGRTMSATARCASATTPAVASATTSRLRAVVEHLTKT